MGFDMGYIDEEMLASWGKESDMNEKLADPARQVLEPAKLALPVNAENNIIPLFHLFQKRKDLIRMVLQVIIHPDDQFPPHIMHRREQSGMLPEISGKVGDRNACEPGDRHAADGRIQPANP